MRNLNQEISESKIEDAFCQWCTDNGHEALKLRPPTGRGFPDRTVLTGDGRVVFLEFKAPGGRPSIHQMRWLKRLRNLGHVAEVVDNLGDAIAQI